MGAQEASKFDNFNVASLFLKPIFKSFSCKINLAC